MKDVKNHDERVIAQRRKIQSDGFQLLIYALLISVLIQQFFLKAPLSQYIVELLCVIGAGFYNLICNLNIGNNIYGDDNDSGKHIFKNALISGVGSIIFFVVLTGEKDIGGILSYGLGFTLAFGSMVYLVSYISKKRQGKIKRELDMDEDDID